MKHVGTVGLCLALLVLPSIPINEAFSSHSSFGSLKKDFLQHIYGDLCSPNPSYIPTRNRIERLFELQSQASFGSLDSTMGDFLRDVRGVYLASSLAGSGQATNLIDQLHNNGGNALVVDLKTVYGDLFVPYQHGFVQEHNLYDPYAIPDFSSLATLIKERGLYLIVRIPCFADQLLALARKELRLRNADDTGVVTDNKLYWLDPSHEEVRGYLLGLMDFALKTYPEIDEVQLDYIRFPAVSGEVLTQADLGQNGRQEVITAFIQEASEVVRIQHQKHLSVAVYGITVWNRTEDLEVIGQNLVQIAPYVDRISGMFYSSHYADGFGGYESPANHPKWIVGRSMNALRNLVQRSHPNLAITPWLQGFDWKLQSFNVDYILQNIEGAAPYGSGYLFWNANGNYELVLDTFGRIHPLPTTDDLSIK